MQLSMKCSIAIHCLIFIYEAKGKVKVTGQLLSESTGVHPVIIRNIISSLKKANIIEVPRGTGGAVLCVDPKELTLYAIYSAIESDGIHALIGVHDCKDRQCPVAQNIYNVLKGPYQKIEDSIKETMESITLQSLIDTFELRIGVQ